MAYISCILTANRKSTVYLFKVTYSHVYAKQAIIAERIAFAQVAKNKKSADLL